MHWSTQTSFPFLSVTSMKNFYDPDSEKNTGNVLRGLVFDRYCFIILVKNEQKVQNIDYLRNILE